jgi:predicted acetyltransferase
LDGGVDERTDWRVVQVTAETKAAFDEVDDIAWFVEHDPTDDDPSGALDLGRSYAATRTGRPPFSGIYSSFDHRLTVPAPRGGLTQLPCAGLTWVAVHPDHRRSGVLTAMVRHHLADARDLGYALGALHASEVGIYGRFGYGQASFDVALEVAGGAEVSAPGVDTSGIGTVLVPAIGDETAQRALRIQHAVAADELGQVALTWGHVRRSFRPDLPHERGSERAKALVAVRDGTDVGYAVLRRTQRWESALPQGRLECRELVASDPAVRLALLRRLLAFDLVGTVVVPAASLEDEVIWWLGGPRAVKAQVRDALWLRLVDVPTALAGRGWSADVDVVLEVADEVCPWNAGRWRLAARQGAATCEPTDAAADVQLPVQVLGAAYLGGRSVTAMQRQGLVTELTPGAVRSLGRALATDVSPAAALMF